MKNSFVDDQNDLYNQCLLFNFRVKIAVFYEQTLYLTTLKEMLQSCNEIYMAGK